jgi:hypothetical protein
MLEDSFREDVFADIAYSMRGGKPKVKTNARDVDEFLAKYIHAITGDGRTDSRKPKDRQEYHVRVGCDLSNDTFRVTSDTGNTSLAVGIISKTIGNWEAV